MVYMELFPEREVITPRLLRVTVIEFELKDIAV